MSQTLVLSVGFDAELLSARDLVLKSAGHIVVSETSIKEAVHRFQEVDFNLVILCHSLPTKDQERLTCLFRASGSRIPIASVSGTLGQCDAFADAILESDPERFLAGISDLLSRQTKMQAASMAHAS